jgi:dCTP deaminase
MTALSSAKIRQRLKHRRLSRRLVVCPILNLSEQLRDGQASLDIRLGCEFALVAPSAFGSVDEISTAGHEPPPLSNLYRRLYVPLGGALVIHPHQLVLAQALEYLRLPADLMAYVVGRSTWGRLGLVVATAIGVQPGYAGCLTLELRNLGEAPLTLRPGQTIAQLFFHTVRGSPGTHTSVSQYGGSANILPGRLSSEYTKDKLSKLSGK